MATLSKQETESKANENRAFEDFFLRETQVTTTSLEAVARAMRYVTQI